MHYSSKMAINFVKDNEMKTNLTRWNTKRFLKGRNEKQIGALQFFEVYKLSKDVGVREIKIFSSIVHSARALFGNKTLTTVSNFRLKGNGNKKFYRLI